MKNIAVKTIISTALLAAAGVSLAQSGPANAFGVVISSTPVVEQVTVPKQVCTTSHVQTFQPSGGGALIGAVVGGALGNQFGHGQGRAIATAVGALGGGIVGNQIEAQNGYYVNQPTQQCHTQNTVENRTVAQNVLYEYAGQRYNVQMPATGDFRPGVRIALQVQAQAPAAPVTQVYSQQPAYPQQIYTQPVQTVTYVHPAPTVVYYDTYDTYRPRYYYNSTPYYPQHHAPRAVQRPVRHTAYPVYPAPRPAYPSHRPGHDDHRNWR